MYASVYLHNNCMKVAQQFKITTIEDNMINEASYRNIIYTLHNSTYSNAYCTHNLQDVKYTNIRFTTGSHISRKWCAIYADRRPPPSSIYEARVTKYRVCLVMRWLSCWGTTLNTYKHTAIIVTKLYIIIHILYQFEC